MVDIQIFNSFEEMMNAERRAREAADARVKPWQVSARSGDILVSLPYEDLPVFHELLDNEKMVKENLWKYGDDYEEEGMYILDTYNEPNMRYYRFCRNYSVMVPQGELGDFHLSTAIGKVSRDQFNELKANGFRI